MMPSQMPDDFREAVKFAAELQSRIFKEKT